MHEYFVTKQICKIARETAKANNLKSVKKIVSELGALTNYEKESVLYYFDQIKLGNEFTETELIINEVPGAEFKIVSVIGENGA